MHARHSDHVSDQWCSSECMRCSWCQVSVLYYQRHMACHTACSIESVQTEKFRQLIMRNFEIVPYRWFSFSPRQLSKFGNVQ